MSAQVAIIAAPTAILLSIFLGDYIGRGKRELFDQPRGDRPDGDRFVVPDDFKSFHSGIHSGELQRDVD